MNNPSAHGPAEDLVPAPRRPGAVDAAQPRRADALDAHALAEALGLAQQEVARLRADQRELADALARVVPDLLARHRAILRLPAAQVDGRGWRGPRAWRGIGLRGWLRGWLPRPVVRWMAPLLPLLRHRRARRHPVARLLRQSLLFDADWYLGQHPDVRAAGVDPAFHYLAFGAAEGRDPGPWFSSADYLRRHPDVARSGVNPLHHYELHGRRERREPGAPAVLRPAGIGARTQSDAPASAAIGAHGDVHAGVHGGVHGDPRARRDFIARASRALDRFLAEPHARLAMPVSDTPALSIVIVVHNRAELTLACLRALRAAMDVPCELIVVDNASRDRSAQLLRRVDGARVLPQRHNLHFLRGANQGAQAARGRHLVFLNNDAMPQPGSLAAALALLDAQASVGAVGGRLILPDGSLQEAGCIVWQDGHCEGHGRGQSPAAPAFAFQRDVDYCSGAFLAVRGDSFARLGGFDGLYIPAYYEDTDLCMRLRALGQRVVYEPAMVALHLESASAPDEHTPSRLTQRNHARFVRRHADALAREHLPRATGDRLRASARPARAGRVLVLDDRIPFPDEGAGNPRAAALLRELVQAGAQVTHVSVTHPVLDIERAHRQLPREIEYLPGGQALARVIGERAGLYPLVIVSRPHNLHLLRRALPAWPGPLAGASLVYDAEALFWPRERMRARVLGVPVAPLLFSEAGELAQAALADTVLSVSEAEAARFRAAGCRDVRVLGHGLPVLPGDAPLAQRAGLLFVGRLAEEGSPNVDGLRWFVREVLPLLRAALGPAEGGALVMAVAGEASPALREELGDASRDGAGGAIRFHGRVEDLTLLYRQARVFIAPARFAAGLPMKVCEAATHGLPVVASGLLADQLGWRDGEALCRADDAAGFAAACARLLRDDAHWAHVRAQALAAARRDFDPAVFTAQVRSLLGLH